MKTVIMAGGRGTRIAGVVSDIPKPMIPIAGMPVLEHELACLRDQGFTDILITVSHLGHVIMDYFGDGSGVSPATGKPFGVRIAYYDETRPLGNAGALLKLRDQFAEPFLLLNADAVFDVDFRRFTDFHRERGGLVTLFTHPNDHPYDSGLLLADESGAVTHWLTKEDARPQWYRNRVNAGIHVIDPVVLDRCGIDPDRIGCDEGGRPFRVDLDRDLLKPLCGTGTMYCYDSPEYVKDMGTPERLEAVRRDFASGAVRAKNLRTPQRAVFLDRDGTINRFVGFLRDPEQLELLEGAAEAIRMLNTAGRLAVVATNQPVIARGEVTRTGLEQIHKKLETELGQRGAYLDRIYYCPHHPDGGFPGEIPELKTDCACRKPKPGLLLQAARELNIELAASWMIGDSERDVLAGRAAGCRTALIGAGDFGQTITAGSLLDAVRQVLAYENKE